MHRYEYSFLNKLPLPEDLSSLLVSLEHLNSFSLQRLKQSPSRFEKLPAEAEARSLQGILALEGQVPPRYKECLHNSYHASLYPGLSTADFLQQALDFSQYICAEKRQALHLALSAYDLATEAVSPLLLVPCFTLDMYCLAPFQEETPGMSLLLARLLLRRSGYELCRCTSLEESIRQFYPFYHRAFTLSCRGWEENQSEYLPYLEIFLSLLYMSFQQAAAAKPGPKPTKRASIESLVLSSAHPISKAEICAALPEVSPTTIEAVLGLMIKSGAIRRIGASRGSRYVRA